MKPHGPTGVLALLVALAGCSSGIGDICMEDADCKPGLRCAVVQGGRGVCTYPEAVQDGTIPPDHPLPDAARDALHDAPADASADAPSDAPRVDLAADARHDAPPAEGSVDAPGDLAWEGGESDAPTTDLGSDGP